MNRNKQNKEQISYIDIDRSILKEFFDINKKLEPTEQIEAILNLLEIALPKLVIPPAPPIKRRIPAKTGRIGGAKRIDLAIAV